ncbi:PhzF family phenazine biosynthesis protein [Ktedonospora formicarum]|uniref:Phenazine biosynthesis protein PhzF n=1 Tax=Ktedonospora formicarum TaxID=2778364 RepID=A0A8J3I1D9_9CHLR|nr:PhzF family phenazine biosynthesis protein [Ktedonospora formicarum]GHO44467.1 phenazine biosynthesis protein PhzF [Ktedonospora formicarum]
MKKLRYILVDVFTNQAFGGNPLAVFPDGQDVTEAEMQALAKELNLSETTFVLPATQEQHTYQLRIFTPARELPMAGHPTLGTTFVLARESMISLQDGTTSITLEEKVGPIPVTIQSRDGIIDMIEMQQPLPRFGAHFERREAIAEMLSLTPDDLDAHLPIQVVSCGVPFLYVPIKSLEAVKDVRFKRDVYERELMDNEAQGVFIFARGGERNGTTIHSRMFAPEMGIVEDAATGAASGPLGAYLTRYKVVEGQDGLVEIVSEQGFEMGRPSIVHIRIERQGEEFSRILVGGQCHYMAEGAFTLA